MRSVLTPRDGVAVAIRGVLGRRGRAVLTSVGIAIGVAAMVAVVGISASSKANVLSVLDGLGTNYLTLTPGQSPGGEAAQLPAESVARLSGVDQVQAVAGVAQLPVTLRRTDLVPATDNRGTVVLAADVAVLATLDGQVAEGTWPAGGDARPTVVLGATAAQRHGACPGQLVWLGDQWFAVTGVLAPMPLAPELDNAALIPEAAAAQRFGYAGSPTTVYVRADPRDVELVRDVAAATADPQHPLEVEVTRPADALEARAATDIAFTTLLLGLGGVALLVGGVGIANVMVISVLERRHEIGVRRALGATRRHIRAQFLLEAVAQSGFGGLAGATLGTAIAVGYAATLGWPVEVPVVGPAGGLAAALLAGAVAGWYPAHRAAALSPAEAVRPG